MIELLSLNLCNYHNFDKRKPRIINFIKELEPDIVVLQEVRDDSRYNAKGDNQAEQINRHLNYPHITFAETMDINLVKGTPDEQERTEGLAVLSKMPILETKKRNLRKHPDDKFTRAIMHVRLMSNKPIDILNVHFSPGIQFAKLHLKETIELSKAWGIKPIIVGDFNIPNPEIIRELAPNYTISADVKKYLSYIPRENAKKDKVYNTEACTLDYILIPKNYEFEYFDCVDKDLSDHSVLIAGILG